MERSERCRGWRHGFASPDASPLFSPALFFLFRGEVFFLALALALLIPVLHIYTMVVPSAH